MCSHRFLFARFMIIPLLCLSLTACGGGRDLEPGLIDDNDPYEGFNRSMFAFNLGLDRYVLKPVAKGYLYVPSFIRTGTRNVLDNLSSPVTLANDILQGEWSRAGVTMARLGINTTLGLLGLFDVASYFNLEQHEEDFGQTLGSYGLGEGSYLVLPFLGPAPPRDLLGQSVDVLFDPITYFADDYLIDGRVLTTSLVADLISGIDARSASLDILDEIERDSVDFYATVRSLYRQNRDAEIANGVIDLDDLPDIDDLDDDLDYVDDSDDF